MSRLSDRGRTLASVALVMVAAVLLVLGTVALYARIQVIDERAFANRAATALEDDDVRQLVSREIVTGLIDHGSADLIAARPLLETIVDAALQTDPFRRVFRSAAVEANRTFFVRDHQSVALNLSDTVAVVRFAAQSVSPKLARELPRSLEPSLLRLQRREFAAQTLRVADRVRVLGIVLPLLALLCLVLSVMLAPERRIGILRVGVGIGAAGILLAAVLLILRAHVLAGVTGTEELSDADLRAAVGGALDAFFGGLFNWALLLGLGGVAVAGAAMALDPADVEDPHARLLRLLSRRPQAAWTRALRGAGAIALGAFVVLSPQLALSLVALLVGAYLVFYGTSELLTLLQRRGVPAADAARGRRRALATAAAVGGAGIAAAVLLVLVVTDEDGPVRAGTAGSGSTSRCNGSAALCGLQLNQAVFAGTHNSYSAADSPGWAITNQRRTIPRQLRDGVRLFLIDPHWGVESGGRVKTDFEAEGRNRNKVAKALPRATLDAAERIAGRVGLRPGEGGAKDVWLCHTVCELGATKMKTALADLREFLEQHRGEVVILFVEPYVPPKAIERVFGDAGLTRYLATLERDAPLPTLGQLVRTNERMVVLTENDADGTVPWYLDGFSFVQDTPLGAETVKQTSCARSRGTADSPLLMMNHWADVVPPRLSANRPFLTRKELVSRARRCARERGMPVNMIPVDFYEEGDLFGAVDELNAEAIERVRRERRAG
jgi:hypothetical protein